MPRIEPQILLGALLLGIGLLEPLGYITGIDFLSDIGFITASSPLPLVFTDRQGMEDFASRFILKWTREDGTIVEKEISPSDFSRLSGPFNRTGVYATAIGYPPRISAQLWKPVLHYGICKKQVLGEALGESSPIHSLELTLATRTQGRNNRWRFNILCPR